MIEAKYNASLYENQLTISGTLEQISNETCVLLRNVYESILEEDGDAAEMFARVITEFCEVCFVPTRAEMVKKMLQRMEEGIREERGNNELNNLYEEMSDLKEMLEDLEDENIDICS